MERAHSEERPRGPLKVDAELRVPLATTWVVHYDLSEPWNDVFLDEGAFFLDLRLSRRPANSRACYREHWSPRRWATSSWCPPARSSTW